MSQAYELGSSYLYNPSAANVSQAINGAVMDSYATSLGFAPSASLGKEIEENVEIIAEKLASTVAQDMLGDAAPNIVEESSPTGPVSTYNATSLAQQQTAGQLKVVQSQLEAVLQPVASAAGAVHYFMGFAMNHNLQEFQKDLVALTGDTLVNLIKHSTPLTQEQYTVFLVESFEKQLEIGADQAAQWVQDTFGKLVIGPEATNFSPVERVRNIISSNPDHVLSMYNSYVRAFDGGKLNASSKLGNVNLTDKVASFMLSKMLDTASLVLKQDGPAIAESGFAPVVPLLIKEFSTIEVVDNVPGTPAASIDNTGATFMIKLFAGIALATAGVATGAAFVFLAGLPVGALVGASVPLVAIALESATATISKDA